MSGTTLRIATRRSKLALAQSHWVKAQLEALEPGLRVELREYVTRGDQITDRPLQQVGGKGLFTKEIEDALLAGEADLAVHSLKDLPAELPAGLVLAAVPEREDPRDAVVLPAGLPVRPELEALPRGARIGSSSFRRSAQILAVRPDLRVESVRGNVDTRLRKLDEGQYDALILAAAGLRRLGLQDRISAALDPEISTPAPAQGALGIEARADDPATTDLLARLNHHATQLAIAAERSVMEQLGGGCSIPLGVYAEITGEQMRLRAMVALPDGSRIVRADDLGEAEKPFVVAHHVTFLLRERGAQEILKAIPRP